MTRLKILSGGQTGMGHTGGLPPFHCNTVGAEKKNGLV
jgi:hypothetical protein